MLGASLCPIASYSTQSISRVGRIPLLKGSWTRGRSGQRSRTTGCPTVPCGPCPLSYRSLKVVLCLGAIACPCIVPGTTNPPLSCGCPRFSNSTSTALSNCGTGRQIAHTRGLTGCEGVVRSSLLDQSYTQSGVFPNLNNTCCHLCRQGPSLLLGAGAAWLVFIPATSCIGPTSISNSHRSSDTTATASSFIPSWGKKRLVIL